MGDITISGIGRSSKEMELPCTVIILSLQKLPIYAKIYTIVTMKEKSTLSLHPQGVPPRLGAGWCSWLKVRSGVLR